MIVATQVTAPLCHHAEGAVWSPSWGGLRWVDMLAGRVLHRDDATGEITSFEVGSTIAAMIRPRTAGGFVVATRDEFVLTDADGTETRRAVEVPSTARLNEGGATPDGALLCGSMMFDARPDGGAMYRMEPDGTVRRIFDGLGISNGLGFTSDGARMYYVDSLTGRIDVFDYNDAVLSGRRPFATIGVDGAGPDGLCVDAEGGVWTALYGGSAVHHYDSTGTLQDIVSVGARQVTSCTFGGADLSTLYITTSREHLADDDDPLAGSVFSAEVGVRGLPPLPYAG